jgi:hypothetical protein
MSLDASLRTLAMKKASEQFLKELTIRLSDRIFVVVNELTWPDQEFIEALLEKFKAFSQFQNESIVVIHNYKNISSLEDLQKQKEVPTSSILNYAD